MNLLETISKSKTLIKKIRSSSFKQITNISLISLVMGSAILISPASVFATARQSVIISDNFNRADSTGSGSTMGSTQTGQTWSHTAGLFGIKDNAVYVSTGCYQFQGPSSVIDSGFSDGDIVATDKPNEIADGKLVFRYTDDNNHYFFRYNSGYGPFQPTYEAYKVLSGQPNLIWTTDPSNPVPALGDKIRIHMSGSTFTFYVNGTSYGSYTDSAPLTGTKHGVGDACTYWHYWDEFTFSTLGNGNLLTNSDFESGNSNWTTPSWFSSVLGAATTLPYMGLESLKATGTSTGPYTYQDVTTSAGKTLELSGFVNVTSANTGMDMNIEMQPYNSNGGTIGNPISVYSTGSTTSGWVHFSQTGVMPTNTTKVRVKVRFVQLNGTAFVDNLMLTSD